MNYAIVTIALISPSQRQKSESRILTFYSNASVAMLTGAAAARRDVRRRVETDPAVTAATPGPALTRDQVDHLPNNLG